MRRDALRFEPFRAGAWTALQVVAYLLCFEVGIALVSTFHDWRPDIGRGIFWYCYHVGFAALALLTNLLLEVPRIGAAPLLRLAVWAGAFAALVAYSLVSWPSLPLAVPFVHACALAATALRETLGRRFGNAARPPASV